MKNDDEKMALMQQMAVQNQAQLNNLHMSQLRGHDNLKPFRDEAFRDGIEAAAKLVDKALYEESGDFVEIMERLAAHIRELKP